MPRPVALAFVLAACACSAPQRRAGGEPAVPSPTGERQPLSEAELKAGLARELDSALPARAVEGPEGLFQARVEAAADPTVEDGETSVTVTVPLGTQNPVLCFVYKSAIDAGVSLRNMIDTLGAGSQLQGIHPVEMAAVAGRPAIFLELVYLTELAAGKKGLGHVKLMASAVEPAAVVCLHDEVGYSATFRRVAKSFLGELTPRPKEPKLAEISVYQVDGVPVGIQHRRVWSRKEGGTIEETSAVLFMLKSPSEFVVEDTATAQTGDEEARLDAYMYLKAKDGEVVLTAEAKRGSDGAYQVKGTRDGKEFTAALKPSDKKGLPTDLFVQRAVRDELLGGKKKELALDKYEASDNPTGLSRIVYRRGAGALDLQYESGALRFAGTASPEGTFERMAAPIGAHQMTMERVFASGGP